MSNTQRRVTFPATLFLAINPDTGEEFLLPTRKEWENDARLALSEYEQNLKVRLQNGENKQGLDRLRAQFAAQQEVFIQQRIAESDAARPGAQERNFTLVKPLYGDLDLIREEATEYDYNAGSNRWNESKYRRLLMEFDGVQEDGKTLTAQEIAVLPPVIADELGMRLSRSINPDQRRLLFTLPPSTLS